VAELKQKIQNALDENRMLVLGIQVLIGFDFRAVFEKGFEQLPRLAQLIKLGSLTVLCVTMALCLAPGANHRIAERGEDTAAFHRLTSWFASLVLFPFAVAMALDLAVAGWKQDEEKQKPQIGDKIRHVLTEARVVLPGAQALLGFQFASMLVEGFDKLPPSLRWLHLASLGCTALAVVFVMTPAAWHRMVEQGEDSERFHRFASAMVVAALVPLALGISGDFYIVSWKVARSVPLAAGLTAGLMVLFFGLWFGVSLARRPVVVARSESVGHPA
jgi:hypothetical protein